MKVLNVAESKARYSQILSSASSGESFIIANHGDPIAMIVPYKSAPLLNRVGFLDHKKYAIPENFNDFMSDEIQSMFEGGND